MKEVGKYTPEEFLEVEEEDNFFEIVTQEVGFIVQHKDEEEALNTQIKLLKNEVDALKLERQEAEDRLIGVMNMYGRRRVKFFDVHFYIKNSRGKQTLVVKKGGTNE